MKPNPKGHGKKYDKSFFLTRITLGEAIKTVVYILNRVPSKAVAKTPYELLERSLVLGIFMFGVVRLRQGHIGLMKDNWTQEQ